jgi:hypothetical protein
VLRCFRIIHDNLIELKESKINATNFRFGVLRGYKTKCVWTGLALKKETEKESSAIL